MKTISLKNLFLLLLSVLSLSATACNTVDGAGQDLENAGDAMRDAAD